MGRVTGVSISIVLFLSACSQEPPPVAPSGMVYIPGGVTQIGSESGMPHERPVFKARVQPFFMDITPVTVRAFGEFIQETGYVTQAELFGDAAVFNDSTRQWELTLGAFWAWPLGPENPPAQEDHPVTQVSWNDAVAYAEWAGKRLPSEIEWEHAARLKSNGQYAWGDDLLEDGEYKANVWNGQFPRFNTNTDGYATTSPVGAFGATEAGLVDMGGNVWEWTADWYRSYVDRNKEFEPNSSSEKAQRGGSFLCEPGWCHGYRVSGRSHSTPETALYHVGFRLVKDIPERR
ncbi:MAG: formylglycine-generating enzyme family protein [Bacteroidetes bacterium]|nr:formylglycine-generating enzyme family protein [Bacteroidota bacterium]MCY4204872.1 formylglycine-generating enzyme family protein [Bacteroidota bacterium]